MRWRLESPEHLLSAQENTKCGEEYVQGEDSNTKLNSGDAVAAA